MEARWRGDMMSVFHIRGFLAGLSIFVFSFVTPSQLRAAASQEQLRTVEQMAIAFAAARDGVIVRNFSPELATQLDVAALQTMRETLEAQGGKLVNVQAGEELGQGSSGDIERVVVPIEYEKLKVQLLFTWKTGQGPDRLWGFAVRPVRRKQAASPASDRSPKFRDAVYVKHSEFREIPVNFGAGNMPVSGLFVMPNRMNDTTPVPAVLLLPDWDMMDADGTIGRKKIMRDLALGLASEEVASLRFDRRASIYPSMDQITYTKEEELLLDAEAGLLVLAANPDVDRNRVYIVGHGAGAWLAPEMIRRHPGLRGMVLISPPDKFDIHYRIKTLQIEGQLESSYDVNNYQTNDFTVMQGALDYFDQGLLEADYFIHDAPASYWYSMKDYNPLPFLEDYKGRTLVLFGGKDYMLDKPVVKTWNDLREENRRIQIVYKEELNRWMAEDNDEAPAKEKTLPGHVEKSIIDLIAKFVKE